MNSLLEFHEVSRKYGRSKALDGASFRVPAGSITALLGPNGAGKSTALKIALNLLRPSSGTARVLGTDSRKLGPAGLARIGYVADGMDLPEWMTVTQFLNWCRPLYPKWDKDFEATLCKQFALPTDRKLRHLSRGQKMKAALASVLSYRPELLVLDEPFSGLDPLVRDEFISGLLELAGDEGFSVVLSSHDIEEVDRLADHVVMMNHGKVLLDESTESLLARHRRVEVVLPENFGDLPALPPTWIAAQSSGRVLRFADTAHEAASFEQAAAKAFPGCPPPEVQPYSLRELFVTLVRAGKADAGI